MRLFALLLVLSFLTAAVLAQQNATSAGLRVITNPGAGVIDLDSLAVGTTFEVSFNQIQEVNYTNGGIQNAINSFSSFVTVQPQNQNYNGINVTSLILTATNLVVSGPTGVTSSDVSIILNILVAQSQGTITLLGSQTYNVTRDMAVLQLTLNNWPAVSPKNQLNIRMNINAGGTLQGNELLLGGASVYFPSVSELTGAPNSGVTLSASTSSSKVTFTMGFNATSNTDYTFVWIGDGTRSSASTLSSVFSFLF